MTEQQLPVLSIQAVSYAVKINNCWRHTREAVLQTGDMLLEAKAKLPHGDFEAMLTTGLDFKPRTAQRLMAVAADPRLRNATHGSLLPTSWRTLYELTRMDDATFGAAIADGTIHPDMERKEISTGTKAAAREV